jgi:hypothetical protein
MPTALTILQIVQKAAQQLGLPAPSILVGNTDPQVVQLLALLEMDGMQLYQDRDWTFLQGEHIINVEAPVDLTGTFTEGGTVITGLSSTAALEANYYIVTGVGMPTNQRVVEIVSATSVRCEMEFVADGTVADLQFARDTYELPSDFDHYIPHTWWDRTNHWMLMGPQSPQFDQWQRSGITTTGPRIRWRQIGRTPTVFRLWPPPTAESTPDALVFEYVNDGWLEHVGGTFGDLITADTDVPLLNSFGMILGVKWRMWQIKGFSYGAMQQEYIDFINRLKARDGGMPDLNMGRRRFPYLITSANVQDGNWPG